MTSENNNIIVGGVIFGPKSSKVLNVQLPNLRDFYHMTLGCDESQKVHLPSNVVCMYGN